MELHLFMNKRKEKVEEGEEAPPNSEVAVNLLV